VYASVHADRASRVLVSRDHQAAALGRDGATAVSDAIPLPAGTRLIAMPRDAIAIGRDGRPRPLGRDRLALGAILPTGYVRLASPAYRDDPGAAPLEPLAYTAVAAGPDGEPLVAAAATGETSEATAHGGAAGALRTHPANALARQLARCARENACVAAAAGLGRGALPAVLGAPPAERPSLPVALRSGYAGGVKEPASFTPTSDEIADVAADHLERGGTSVAFGRACDGEPLMRVRVLEEAVRAIRDRRPDAVVHLETCGSDTSALRRAIDAGVASVTVRIGSTRGVTYDRLHGPTAHRWTDVQASVRAVAEGGARLTIALLLLPGLTDRADEVDALMALLGDLPGGTLDLRDLGCDPLRVLAAFPGGAAGGTRAFLARLADADHFPIRSRAPAVAVR
jgi:hypothetical protein